MPCKAINIFSLEPCKGNCALRDAVYVSGSHTFCVAEHFSGEKFVTEYYRRPYAKGTYVHIWLFLPNCIFQVVILLSYSKSTNYFSNSKWLTNDSSIDDGRHLTFGHVKHQVLFNPKCCFLH